jgi:hypothetical protein
MIKMMKFKGFNAARIPAELTPTAFVGDRHLPDFHPPFPHGFDHVLTSI